MGSKVVESADDDTPIGGCSIGNPVQPIAIEKPGHFHVGKVGRQFW